MTLVQIHNDMKLYKGIFVPKIQNTFRKYLILFSKFKFIFHVLIVKFLMVKVHIFQTGVGEL